MAVVKKRRDHSVLEVVGGAVALIVGLVLVLALDGTGADVGLVLMLAGIILLILGFVQYGRNVRAVSKTIMGAAVKLNQPTDKVE